MLIVDSQIHIWENGKMSPHHRQIPTYGIDDALAEMKSAGVDAAVIHPPSSLGEPPNELAVRAVKLHPEKFCILGHFDLQAPNREEIVKHWRERPGMLGFRYTFNQPHEKTWWTDGSLDWFWKACEKADSAWSLGQWEQHRGIGQDRRAASRPQDAHRPYRTRRRPSRCEGDAAYANLSEMLALAKLPNVSVKLSGAPSTSRGATPTRTFTSTCSRSSRRSVPTAASGVPTSPACRSRIGNA